MARITKKPVAEALTLPALPRWMRCEPPLTDPHEAAFAAGAALAMLDTRMRADVRAQVPFAGVWRRRLALKAAAATVRMARRGEDEAMLRDCFFLRHGSDDPGPAGRILLAWRALDRSASLDEDTVVHVAGLFGLRDDDALKAAIAGVQQIGAAKEAAPFAAAQAATLALTQRGDAVFLALWLADAVLARRLKWPLPLPLLASGLLHPSLRHHGRRPHPGEESWAANCCAAYAIAATQACDLFDALERGSQKLIAIETRLRAKGARAVIDRLHDEDAVPPSGRIGTMSERALRRLFERLVALGAVRELTGRSTFRLYGL